MKKISAALLLTTTLTLGACGQAGEQWINPDKTFALFDQPVVKGVNDTQEDMAKEAVAGGDYARASQYYQQLVATKKGTPEQILGYKMGLADATRRVGDGELALAMYEELFTENPGNLDIAEGRALCLMARGKTVDAGRAFADVLAKDQNRWRSLNAVGILFVTKNMITEAMAYYTEALKHSPDNAAVLNNIGLSQAVGRNFPPAIDALRQGSRASKVPSQRKQIEMNLAMVYGVSGDLETAREVASKYLEGAALDNNLGLYAHLAKDDALAKSYLNMALSQSPTYYERAWGNLDVINDNGGNNGNKPPLAVAPSVPKAPLPKLETLRPAAAPDAANAPKVEVEPAVKVAPSAAPSPAVYKVD